MKKLILSAFYVALSLFVSAQELLDVSGKLIMPENNSPDAINVILEGTNYGGLVNENGTFAFKAAPGKYTLVVSSLQYHKIEMPVEIRKNKKNHFNNIVLKALTKDLEEVVVTGTRTEKSLADAPILTKVIGKKDIEQTGCVSALDALETVMPGIQFSPDAHGDNMTIQGLDNRYILVLVDGERMIGETRGNVNFNRIAASEIKQIEIVNGASSVLYGSNAIGGVINIITKRAEKKFQGMLDNRYSNFNTWNTNVNVATKRDKLNLKIDGFRNSSDGYDLTPETPESFTANPFADYSLTAKLAYTPIKKLAIETHGTVFRHESFNPEKSLKSSHGLSYNYAAGGKISYDFSPNHNLTLGIKSDKYASFIIYDKLDSIAKHSDYSYKTFTLTDVYNISDKLEIISGAEVNMENIFSTTLFGTEDKDKNKKSQDFNLFLQADWRLLKKLELIGGMRYTNHSAFGNHYTPNISAMYNVFKGLKIRGTAALGYKSPSLKELYYNFDHQGMFWIYGNENLKPETARYLSVSGEYTYKSFNVSLTGYSNLIKNKIELISINNTITDRLELHHRNISEAQLQGIETYVNWKFLSNFKLKAGYAYSDAKDKSTGFQISGNSKHTGTTLLTFYTNHKSFPFSLTVSGKMFSPRLYQEKIINESGQEEVNIEQSKPYSIWKFTYIQKIPIWKNIHSEIRLGVNNIFNYSEIEKSAVLNPGRTFWAALSIKW